MKTKREFSAGGCVYKKVKSQKSKGKSEEYAGHDEVKIVWLVGKHSGYHKWVLPKGFIEEGETARETAVRETEEEMGVVGKIVGEEPIHSEEYWFIARLVEPKSKVKSEKSKKPIRRVAVYKEDPGFEESADNVKVFKTVKFYLMEWEAGDPDKHGWEMEKCGWFEFEEAVELLAFEGEREALKKAAIEIEKNT